MNRVVQSQAQQAPHLPLAPNQPRQEIIIDLISDDDEESGPEDFIEFEEEDDYEDAPEIPESPIQSPLLGHVQQQAAEGARFGFVDLIDGELQHIVPPAPAPARPVSPPRARNQPWGDYILDDDFDAEEFARAIELEQDWRFMAEPPAPAGPEMPPRPHPAAAAAPVQQIPQPAALAEPKDECVQMVVSVFPGICVDHVSDIYDKIAKASERLIAHILDQMDKGIIYPKAKDKAKDLKRKRDIDEIEEAARKYGAPDRVISANVGGVRPYM
jgi:E3 ubiquitin-protein ligase RNF216